MIRDTFAESPGDYKIQCDLAGNHDDGTVHRGKVHSFPRFDYLRRVRSMAIKERRRAAGG